jgi:cytochrome c nitrite reductase small subunit
MRRALVAFLLLGIPAGVGAFTFVYAKGFSYLSTDPRACVRCHAGLVHDLLATAGAARGAIDCMHCHAGAGHGAGG